MARLFTRASSHYLELAATVATAAPITMACWFRSGDTTVDQTLMGIFDTAGNQNLFELTAAGTQVGDPLFATTVATTQANATTSTGFSANTWHHACAVFAAANSRAVYIDGGSKGTDANSRTPAGLDVTAVGRRSINVPTNYMSGRICEAAVWNVALSDAEVLALARGIHPFRMRPGSCVAYWPIWGLHSPEIDLCPVPQAITVNGAVLADHAPLEPFSHRRWAGTGATQSGRRQLLLGVGGR